MNRFLQLLAAIFLFIPNLKAQDGAVDSSYGSNGIVKADFGMATSYSSNLIKGLVDSDGSVYLVLKLQDKAVVQKLRPDGSPDLSYGDNGYSVLIEQISAKAAALKDGKVFIGGSWFANNSWDIVIGALKADGTFDSTFGGTGRQIFTFGDYSNVGAMDIQPDGKILVAGYLDFAERLFVFRLDTSGNEDKSFTRYYGPSTSFPGWIDMTKEWKNISGGIRTRQWRFANSPIKYRVN